MNIVARTLSEQACDIIRERIVTGSLSHEVPIRQDTLAAELGVSKIPLREALARLEQDGLLTSQVNRGYFVRPMSAEEAEEIFELRLSIEPRAAGRAAVAANDRARLAAEQALADLDAGTDKHAPNVAILNRTFHMALVRPGGRLLTTQLVERLHVLSERYVVAHLKPAGREDRATLEHRHLLDAWLAADATATARLLTEHIEGTLSDLRSELGAATTR